MGYNLQFEKCLNWHSASETFPDSSGWIRIPLFKHLLHSYFPAELSSQFVMFMSVSPTKLLSSMRSGTTAMMAMAHYCSLSFRHYAQLIFVEWTNKGIKLTVCYSSQECFSSTVHLIVELLAHSLIVGFLVYFWDGENWMGGVGYKGTQTLFGCIYKDLIWNIFHKIWYLFHKTLESSFTLLSHSLPISKSAQCYI